MAYPIRRGEKQGGARGPIATIPTGSGCMPDMTSQYLNASKLHIGNMDQYVGKYTDGECCPPQCWDVTLE